MKRRDLLVAMIIAAVADLPARMLRAGEELSAAQARSAAPDWQSVLECMFPRRKIGAELYAVPAQALTEAAGKDPASDELLRSGWEQLSRACGVPWAAASVSQRTHAIAGIEGSALFTLLRQTMVFTFYNDPRVWAECGYEGDSWHRGGYAGPDLLTIDWLPGQSRG